MSDFVRENEFYFLFAAHDSEQLLPEFGVYYGELVRGFQLLVLVRRFISTTEAVEWTIPHAEHLL